MRYRVLFLTLGFLLIISMNVTFAATEVPVFNGNFEAKPPIGDFSEALGLVPFGWVIATGPSDPSDTSNWSVGLSDEMAYDGDYSLRVLTTDRVGSILIASKPLPVEGGKTYALQAHIYNTVEPQGRLMVYLEFWDENGWWGDTDYWSEDRWQGQERGRWRQAVRLHERNVQSTEFNTWQEMFLTTEAPSNAKYLTVSVWTANRVMKSYIDGIRVAEID